MSKQNLAEAQKCEEADKKEKAKSTRTKESTGQKKKPSDYDSTRKLSRLQC